MPTPYPNCATGCCACPSLEPRGSGILRRPNYTAANPDFAAVTRNGVLSMPVVRFLGFDFSKVEPGATGLTLPYREELSFRSGMFQGAIVGSARAITSR